MAAITLATWLIILGLPFLITADDHNTIVAEKEEAKRIAEERLAEAKRKEEFKNTLEEKRTNRLKKYGRSCLLYTSPSPRDRTRSRMPSSA